MRKTTYILWYLTQIKIAIFKLTYFIDVKNKKLFCFFKKKLLFSFTEQWRNSFKIKYRFKNNQICVRNKEVIVQNRKIKGIRKLTLIIIQPSLWRKTIRKMLRYKIKQHRFSYYWLGELLTFTNYRKPQYRTVSLYFTISTHKWRN